MTKLSKKQITEIIDFVNEKGATRKRAQGENFNEVDFAMGAASVFFALEIQEQIPTTWVFNPMCGKPIFNQGAKRQ